MISHIIMIARTFEHDDAHRIIRAVLEINHPQPQLTGAQTT